jgi:HEPN domain-containing protein
MLRELPEEVRPERALYKKAADLDKLYIPARYPNGFESGAPMDYFEKEDAEKAVEDAREVINYAKGKISK